MRRATGDDRVRMLIGILSDTHGDTAAASLALAILQGQGASRSISTAATSARPP